MSVIEKAWASLVKQTQYKEELQQSLEDIQNCAQAINEEAAHCQARVMVEVRETSQSQSRIMVEVHDMMRHQVTSRDKYIRSLHKLLLTHPSLRLERSGEFFSLSHLLSESVALIHSQSATRQRSM